MLFNSVDFLLFFPAVVAVYFLLGKNSRRIPFLLAASYFFYMNWEPAYAALILTSTVVTWSCGLLVERSAGNERRKKGFLVASLAINFGILFFFKYFDFFAESVFALLSALGLRMQVPGLRVLLPVGISFYTFQAVGYTVDVYRGTIRAERNFVVYALFVSFFPQLVAGPIERAKNLLPQFREEHSFRPAEAAEGLKLMLWGLFMKACVADVAAEFVDAVYDNVPNHGGASLLVATILFAFQVYCDFAGYSCIAAGAARTMGFRLMENFRQPYFSASIKEFWRRWHVSLSSWLTDYVYIPLGGNRVPFLRHLANLLVTFLASGLWHGANWTFVAWGALHGIYLVLETAARRCAGDSGIFRSRAARILRVPACFALVCFAWIFFRADSLGTAFSVVGKIFGDRGTLFETNASFWLCSLLGIAVLLLKDVKDRFGKGPLLLHSPRGAVRLAAAVGLTAWILLFGAFGSRAFIYFQF